MKRTFLLVLGLLALAITGATPSAWANTCDRTEDITLLGQNLTVESGEVFCGDIALMGGSLVVEAEAEVRGDIAIAGGSATVDGTVDGDIAVFGGHVTLGETALVTGDVALAGGSLNRAKGARVEGQVAEASEIPDLGLRFTPGTFNFLEGGVIRQRSPASLLLAATWWVIRTIVTIFILAVLAFLIAVLAPRALRNSKQTAEQAPVESFAVGCLGMLALFILIVLSAITIIGIPVALALIVVLVAGLLYGLTVVGTIIGERLLQGLNISPIRLTTAAVIGVVLFEAIRTLADIVPFAGGLLSFTLSAIVMSIGVGAALLSRGGQRVYPGGTISGYLPGTTGHNAPPPTPDTPDTPDPLDSIFADLDTDQSDDTSDESEDDQPSTPIS